ncbi:MAG: protein kinase [Gemmatimonadales bacterium]|nr:protein kinase [Gemmatimonadales bacterium]MDZ4388138.1 protein kinase [Gemmatimonadales bacterium]
MIERLRTSLADRYRLERELGAGGMATVYLAHDLKHERDVAIKVLHPDLGAALGAERFLAEIKITARLDHPHILTLIDSGAADGLLYYVLPYVRGETLRARLQRERQLDIDESIAITRDIASALEYAHRQGVVHRDIKPENIIFLEGEPMLADFGIALAVKEAGGDRLTQTGLSLGTPQYMSPEQATGERALDARSDVYSLAAVLYEMLTGDPPVTGATAQAMIAKLMTERPTRIRVVRDAVPEPVDTAVFRALAKIPADRFSGAREFADALDAGMRPGLSVPAAAPAAAGRQRMVIVAALAVALVAMVAMVIRGRTDTPAAPPPVALEPGRQVSFVGDVGKFTLAPDDRTVAYLTPDRARVVLFDLDGGGTQTLYTAPEGTATDDLHWSPDGARLLLTAFPYSNRIFSVPRLGGVPREELRLATLTSLSGSVVLPLENGLWLVAGRSNTFYLGADPTAARAAGTQLEGPGTFAIPGLSSIVEATLRPTMDGKWLAYEGATPDGQDVGGIVALSLTEAPRVIAQWPGMSPVGWSADARRLVMRRPVGDQVSDLLSIGFDPETGRTTGEPQLIYPRLVASDITLSADGQRIVYVAGAEVMNLREVVLDRTPAFEDNPSRMVTQGTGRWSIGLFLPDGDVIALQRTGNGIEARRFDRDGTSQPVMQRADSGLRWANALSTDGQVLASARLQGGQTTLFLHDLATSRAQEVALPQEPSKLAWSPDGRFIAAMTAYSPDEMMVIDVAAGTTRVVKLQCGEKCEFAWENVAVGDAWPEVAITSEVDTWIANVETGALRHLAANTWYVIGWVDDWVYFVRAGGQTDYPGMVLYRIPAAGGTEERLLTLPVACALASGISLSLDATRVLCAMDESKQDLYVISNVGTSR